MGIWQARREAERMNGMRKEAESVFIARRGGADWPESVARDLDTGRVQFLPCDHITRSTISTGSSFDFLVYCPRGPSPMVGERVAR